MPSWSSRPSRSRPLASGTALPSLVHHSNLGVRYLSLRYTERLAEAVGEVGSRGVRSQASLVVLSKTIGSTTIARRLGMVPDESWRVGDRRSGATRHTNGWSVNGSLQSVAADESLEQLLARMDPVHTQLAALAAEDGVQVRLWLYIEGAGSNLTVVLPSHQLERIAALGAELAMDAYVGVTGGQTIEAAVPTTPSVD